MSPLGSLIARRVLVALATLVLVSLAVFATSLLIEGDVAEAVLGQSATPQAVAGLRAALHLDRPAWVRYLAWAGGMVRGDPGTSLVTGMPVAALIAPRLGNSLALAGVTAIVAVPLALTLGIVAAVRRGTAFDRAISLGTIAIVSVPEFLIATLLVMVFAVKLRWLPALSSMRDLTSMADMARMFVLPVAALACIVVAQMVRMTRAAVIDALESSYAEAARLKGVSSRRLVFGHALPNAVGPIANAVALSLPRCSGGSS
ncbi:MAG: ABC transporter permease [Sphingomonas fennica]